MTQNGLGLTLEKCPRVSPREHSWKGQVLAIPQVDGQSTAGSAHPGLWGG